MLSPVFVGFLCIYLRFRSILPEQYYEKGRFTMKIFVALILSALLCVGGLTGCGCSRLDPMPETTVPLATVRPTTEPTTEPTTRPTFPEPSDYETTEITEGTIEDGNGPAFTEETDRSY